MGKQRGISLFERARYAQAEAEFRQALTKDPDNPELHHWLGCAAFEQGAFENAEPAFRRAAELHPQRVIYHLHYAQACAAIGRPREAEESYRRALSLDPRLVEARLALGTGLYNDKRYDEAVVEFEAALKEVPTDAGLHNWIGRARMAQKRYGDAEGAFLNAINLQPREPAYHFNLGLVLSEQKRDKEAETAYRKSVDAQSTYARGWIELGRSLFQQRRLEEAKDAFEKARNLKPDNAAVHNWLGRIELMAGHNEPAAQCFRRATELDAAELAYAYNLGLALSRLKRDAEAEAAFRQVLALDKDYAPARTALGAGLYAQQRYAEAKAEFAAARERNPDDDEIYNWLGRIALIETDNVAAEVLFREAMRLRSGEPTYLYNWGLALETLGRLSEAEAAWHEALNLRPGYPLARRRLANLLHEQKRYGELRAEFESESQDDVVLNTLGRAALAERRFADAEAAFRAAMRLSPEAAAYRYNLGLALTGLGQLGDAQEAYRQALAADGQFAAARRALATSFYDEGRYDEARVEQELLLRANPDDPIVHNTLGRIALAQARADDAERDFRAAIRLRPGDAVYNYNLGLALVRLGHGREAEAAFRHALSLDSRLSDAHRALGSLLFDDARYDEAAAEFNAIKNLDPSEADAHNWLGRIALAQNRHPDAESAFREAIRLQPAEAVYSFNLGLALARAGRTEEAESVYRHALDLDPISIDVHKALGALLFEQGRHAEAQTILERVQAAAEDDPELLSWIGAVAVQQERFADAEEAFRTAAELSPNNAAVLYNVGVVLQQREDYPQAEVWYRRALEISPNDLETLQNLGTVVFEQGRYDEARLFFEKIRALRPGDAEIHNWIGRSALAQESDDEAERAFREAMRLDDKEPAYPYNLGLALDNLNRPLDAEAAFRASLARQGTYRDARNLLCGLLYDQGRFEEILVDCDRMEGTDGHHWLGQIALRHRRYSDAETAFRMAAGMQPNVWEHRYHLGLALEKLDRLEEAEATYREAVNIDVNVPYARHQLSLLLDRQGRREEARQQLAEARASYGRVIEDQNSRSVSDFRYLGNMVERIFAEPDEAEKIYTEGLKPKITFRRVGLLTDLARLCLDRSEQLRDYTEPDHHDQESKEGAVLANYYKARKFLNQAETVAGQPAVKVSRPKVMLEVGRCFVEIGEPERAEPYLLKAAEGPNEATDALAYLGAACLLRDDVRPAIRYLERAVREEPADPALRAHLGDAYLRAGLTERAEIQYRRVLAAVPDDVAASVGLGRVYLALADEGDSDRYVDAIRHFDSALSRSRSGRAGEGAHGSARLPLAARKARAVTFYERAYARVKLHQTQKGRRDPNLLRLAADDLQRCLNNDVTNHAARRAKQKLARYFSEQSEERVGKWLVCGIALALSIGSQFAAGIAMYHGTPVNLGYYSLFTFGGLVFLIAGLYLPQILKLKVAGLELQKSAGDNVDRTIELQKLRPDVSPDSFRGWLTPGDRPGPQTLPANKPPQVRPTTPSDVSPQPQDKATPLRAMPEKKEEAPIGQDLRSQSPPVPEISP